jgi:hypothetical protein
MEMVESVVIAFYRTTWPTGSSALVPVLVADRTSSLPFMRTSSSTLSLAYSTLFQVLIVSFRISSSPRSAIY